MNEDFDQRYALWYFRFYFSSRMEDIAEIQGEVSGVLSRDLGGKMSFQASAMTRPGSSGMLS